MGLQTEEYFILKIHHMLVAQNSFIGYSLLEGELYRHGSDLIHSLVYFLLFDWRETYFNEDILIMMSLLLMLIYIIF